MNQILNGTEITRSTVPPSNADRHIDWFSKARSVGYDFLTGPRYAIDAAADGRDNNYQESFNYEH